MSAGEATTSSRAQANIDMMTYSKFEQEITKLFWKQTHLQLTLTSQGAQSHVCVTCLTQKVICVMVDAIPRYSDKAPCIDCAYGSLYT